MKKTHVLDKLLLGMSCSSTLMNQEHIVNTVCLNTTTHKIRSCIAG